MFPSLVVGMNDYQLTSFAQFGTYEEFYRSELPGKLLEAARDANDLLRDYTIWRVTGFIASRGKIASILGKAAGLSDNQVNLLKDSLAIRAFADQQGLNMSQLENLSDILIQNNQNINQVMIDLQD
jgi:hypothetical protein